MKTLAFFALFFFSFCFAFQLVSSIYYHIIKRADGESIRRTLRTDIYRMIKLNFIRELVGKVEAGGITNFCKKRDIKEMMNFLNSLLIPSMAVDSTDSSLDTSVAPSGRCRNEQHSKPQNIS